MTFKNGLNNLKTKHNINTMSLDAYLESLYQKALYNVKEHIEMLYIQAKSKISKDSIKEIDEKLIEDYLKKRGYTMNYILGKKVMIKNFTCVFVDKNVVEVWHDKSQNNKSVFVNESLLTGLPITLNYMERILFLSKTKYEKLGEPFNVLEPKITNNSIKVLNLI